MTWINQKAKSCMENRTRAFVSRQITEVWRRIAWQEPLPAAWASTAKTSTKNQLLGLLSYWFPGKCSLCLISPSSILNQISFAEQERTRNPGSEKDFDQHVIGCVLCNFWWVQIDSEKFSAKKDLRGNLAQPTFFPMLLMWRLRPRERRWSAHNEWATTHRLSRVSGWSSPCPTQSPSFFHSQTRG